MSIITAGSQKKSPAGGTASDASAGVNGKPGANGKLGGLRPIDGRAVEFTRHFLGRVQAEYPDVRVVKQVDLSKIPCNVVSETAPMREVVMTMPTYLDFSVEHAINRTERKIIRTLLKTGVDLRPDRYVACVEQANLIETLLKLRVHVVLIDPLQDDPTAIQREMVYTRDQLVVMGNLPVRCSLALPERKGEEIYYAGGLKPPEGAVVEGGNHHLIDGKYSYLGVNERTNDLAVQWWQSQFGAQYEIFTFRLKQGILHSDCRSFYAKGLAVVDERAYIDPGELDVVRKQFGGGYIAADKIPDPALRKKLLQEMKNMSANIICVGPNLWLVSTSSPTFGQLLTERGHTVLYVQYDEAKKAEGSKRCNTAPLVQCD